MRQMGLGTHKHCVWRIPSRNRIFLHEKQYQKDVQAVHAFKASEQFSSFPGFVLTSREDVSGFACE
jgi:hypothetical protein